jgi:hypothetical protein
MELEKVHMSFYADGRLRKICCDLADEEGEILSDWLARIVATHPDVGRPDLAKVPRKRLGRRRKDELASSA